MRIHFSSALCIGCSSCELVCSASHVGEFNPARSRIRVEDDHSTGGSVINVCRSCPKPRCVKACTYGACRWDQELGVVKIDYGSCVACYACVEACPFHADFVDPVEHVPIICDGCGGDPLCVRLCRQEAIKVARTSRE